MIPLAAPDIDDDDVAAVANVLRSGQLVQHARVAEFEEAIAQHCGVSGSVAVNSCTSALHLALLAVGVQPGDVVAVAPYSWPATANVIELCRARPVFIDITADTWTMDATILGEALAAQRVRAVLVVHAFGGMADMRAILAVAAAAGAVVVEDAACALAASLEDRPAGSWGTLGCVSFHPRKAVTTGEGGAVVGNDTEQLATVRRLRNHGVVLTAGAPDFVEPGYNLRLTEFQAALGTMQLRKLERLLSARLERARRYDYLLADLPLQLPVALPASRHVYQSYIVLLPRDVAPRRAAIIATLRERGIETQIGTHHIPGLTYYRRKYGGECCPTSADVASRALALPLHTRLTAEDQAFVVRSLGDVL